MKDGWRNKLNDVKMIGKSVLNDLENKSNKSKENELSLKFKNFCGISFNFVNDWIDRRDCLVNEYIDICHGISNCDKHFKIDRYKEKYNSDQAIYRLSTSNSFQSSTGCYTSECNSELYKNPGSNIILVEIICNGESKIYSAKEIVEGTFKEIEMFV